MSLQEWLGVIGVIGLLVVAGFFRSPAGKGFLGELQVKSELKWAFRKKGIVINNFIYIDKDYKSAVNSKHIKTIQIDHIVISTKGVLVIETKNYAGRIYGSKSQSEWTQVLNYGKVKNKLHNPIKQNETHCYYVKKIVGENVPIRSIVVFVKNNTEHIICTGEVVNLDNLKKYISFLPVLLTQDQVVEIADKLQSVDQSGVISKRQHKKNVKNLLNDADAGACPWCGAALVYKNGQYGDYMGCSNFPKCKFKRKI